MSTIDATIAQRIYVSNRAHIVFPYHREVDALHEALKQKHSKEIGTTKRGIGPANLSKVARIGIRTLRIRFQQ
jgi:adenylosuccinate synthase